MLFQSGKSSFICTLIENRNEMITEKFERIIYCQHEDLSFRQNETVSRLKKSFESLEVVSGLPDVSRLRLDCSPSSASLLILDDLQNAFLDSPAMLNLLMVQIHHWNISLIVTFQSYFHKSKQGKSQIRQMHYKVFFYNRLDLTELRNISIQIRPNNSTFLHSCFEFLTSNHIESHPYIVVDGHYKSTDPQLFIRSNIFPDKQGHTNPIIFFSAI